MKVIYAILFFVVVSIWIYLIFMFLKSLDTGASTGKFFLMLLAIAASTGLFFFLISKYIDMPSSGHEK